MKIKPMNDRVIVMRVEEEQKTAGDIKKAGGELACIPNERFSGRSRQSQKFHRY